MTKVVNNKNFKRVTATILAVIVLLGTVFVMPVNAVGKSVTVTFDYCYDTAGNIIKYVQKTTAPNGTTVGTVGEELCRIYVDGKDAYCIEPGVYLMSGDTVTEDASTTWKNLGSAKQKAINLALLYGKPGNSSNMSGTAGQQWIATQLIIWEFVTGCRSTSDGFKCTDKRFYNGICGGDSNTGVQTNYNKISNLLAEYSTVPSFASVLKSKAETYEMKYKDGEYSVTLKDENKVLDEFNFKATDGVKVSVSGNKLTLTSSKPVDNEVSFTSAKKMPSVSSSSQLIAYGSSSVQDVISGVEPESDPVKAYFSVKTMTGNLKLKKTSEDGIVEGIKFTVTVTGTDYSKTVTTDKDGTFTLTDLVPGTYTVTETVATRYAEQESKTVKVESGKTATVTFSNVLKKWRAKVTKIDADTTTAQGDATLSGAVYGVYEDGKLKDKYTTNSKGEFTTSYYTCGANWTIKEITPSEGYLLNESEYKVGATAGTFTLEKNTIDKSVKEKVIKGNVSIIKHTDDGSTKIETPEKGAEFQVYLKSSGSYAKAKESERDTLVCDEYGFAETKDLPYGTYTVHQTKGWNGTEFIADFDVFISENNKTYKYLINNASLESYLKIVKTDADTGKQIPYAGAGFQVYSPKGELVTMKYTYPSVTKIDTFYTNEDGYLVSPEKLPYGKGYSIVEVQAPYGYVLDSTPVYFDITAENTTSEDGITVVKAEKKDKVQMGTITVTKTGEIFKTVSNTDNVYQPVYEKSNLEGAVFEIYADEDITMPDGTVRVAKDTLVDTITTGENGTAKSKELYLGKYRLVETQTLDGYVLSTEPTTVEITYADQEVAVTNVDTSINNERQKAEVNLKKILEETKDYQADNKEILNVSFALYAKDEIKASDGTAIPKDGLVEIINCKEDGTATFTNDLPFGNYYVQEYTTDDHYVIDDTKYEFSFEYTDPHTSKQVININGGENIINKLLHGKVTTTKVDEEYPKNKLSGATFVVYRDSNGNKEFDKADKVCGEMKEVKKGVYELDNLTYGGYFLYEKTAPIGFVRDKEHYYFEITKNSETVVIENKSGVGFTDRKITGSLEITKKDISSGELLPDSGFRIKDENGKTVVEGYTNKKGLAKFTLTYGKYTYEEFDAPDGYIIDTTPHSFEISKDGQIVKAEMTNKAEKQENPKTGDSNHGFLIGIIAVILGGVISAVVIKLRGKKDEDDD
ncbi:MAG: SpaA isopeptide-forming pilin-related protein [Oscillospiraceae bacterium]|nr:SpaA isopeptide-forming pilin-related protein [Oscillospiraceae bacterium]